MTEDAFLSREEALALLNDLQNFLPRLEAGELDQEAVEQAERLMRGLAQIPLPPDILEEHAKEMGMWSDALLKARGDEWADKDTPVGRQLENRVMRLKGMVEEGVEP